MFSKKNVVSWKISFHTYKILFNYFKWFDQNHKIDTLYLRYCSYFEKASKEKKTYFLKPDS